MGEALPDLRILADGIGAYERRSGTYDELFEVTSLTIRAAQSAGKAELAALAFWKRLNCSAIWVTQLLHRTEAEIRDVTRAAFTAPDCPARFRTLAGLPGFKNWGPFASAILCAYDPDSYAVRDRRALVGLARLGAPVNGGRGVAVRYHGRVLQLRDPLRERQGWSAATARQIDKGLFELGA